MGLFFFQDLHQRIVARGRAFSRVSLSKIMVALLRMWCQEEWMEVGASALRLSRQFTWVSPHTQGSFSSRIVTESLRWREDRVMRQGRGIARESLITLKLVFSYSICSRPHSRTYCYSSLLLVSQLLTMDIRQLFPVLGRRRNFCRCCCLAVVISIGTLAVTTLLPEYYSCQCLMKGYFILSSF